VDATIIEALSSTKIKDGARDPAMYQTKNGNRWHFAIKAHIRVDAESGLTHTLVTTDANVSDITQTHALLHGDESATFGGGYFQGVKNRQDNQSRSLKWHVALGPGKRRALPDTKTGRLREQLEKLKAVFGLRLGIRLTSSSTFLATRGRAIAE